MRLELTRRADYAIRTVILLARQERGEVTSGPRVASQMAIPTRFLPHVMGDLARAGIVEATIGRGGGYRLVRDPESLSLLEVIETVEGDPRRRTCVLRTGGCDAEHPCDVHPVFAAAQEAFLERLASTTVADVVAMRQPQGRHRRHAGTEAR